MQLLELKLTHFKNYESEQVKLSPWLNCFTGLNGMGKTNLLDAIYYLCMCKSCHHIRDLHLVKRGESFFRIEGHVGKSVDEVFAELEKSRKSRNLPFEIVPIQIENNER